MPRKIAAPDLAIFATCDATGKGYRTKAEEAAGGPPTVMRFSGYANTKDLDEVRDIVLPQAFEKTLSSFMEFPSLFFQHDIFSPAGKIVKGEIDDRGLAVDGEIFLDTTVGHDVGIFVEHEALRAMSIGYNIPQGGVKYDADLDAFIITELDLHEVSIVSRPANRNALLTVGKQVKAWSRNQTRFEHLGRKAKATRSGGHAAEEFPVEAKQALVATLAHAALEQDSMMQSARVLVSGSFPKE